MMQHDSKILLAYHSIGQIDYIMLGLGLGMVFIKSAPLIAMLGMIAGIYHLANHTCFKGLLFLNAGIVDEVSKYLKDQGARFVSSVGVDVREFEEGFLVAHIFSLDSEKIFFIIKTYLDAKQPKGN